VNIVTEDISVLYTIASRASERGKCRCPRIQVYSYMF